MDLILHQYDFSNFSEKIRLIFGLKQLPWYAVEIPSHLPKPDYTPLTGGYRRTPALQIGADIFCDTQLIAQELEKRFPAPSLYGDANVERVRAMSDCLAPWAEGPLLWPAALYITGLHAEKFPEAFHTDRAYLHNKPPPSREQVRTAGLRYEAEMAMQMARIENLLSHEQPYLLGSVPTIADLIVYGAPWLLETIGGSSPTIDKLLRTREWLGRIANIGHGKKTPLAAERALKIACDQEPNPVSLQSQIPNNLALGDQVTVAPRDENSPAQGILVAMDAQQIIIQVEHAAINRVNVHFPRIGYRVSRLKQ